MIHRVRLFLLLVIVFAVARPVAADAQSCSASITPPSFGAVELLSGSAATTLGAIQVSCTGTPNTTVHVCPVFSAGSGGASVDGAVRYASGSGGGTIGYNLYLDGGYGTVWGGNFGGTTAPSMPIALGSAGNGSSANTPIYGRIFANQTTALTGTYTSTIPVTLYAAYDPGACNTGTLSSTSFAVTATYDPACSLSTPALIFPSFSTLPSAVTGETSLSVTCSNGVAYQIAMDGGSTGATDPEQRRMSLGANTLAYGLYRDLGRTQPWGNSPGIDTFGATGTGLPQARSVYGRIPVQPVPPPGTYTDTVVVTVSN